MDTNTLFVRASLLGLVQEIRVRKKLAKIKFQGASVLAQKENRDEKETKLLENLTKGGTRDYGIYAEFRKRARSTHLAFGYLRSIPYAAMEFNAKTKPDVAEITLILGGILKSASLGDLSKSILAWSQIPATEEQITQYNMVRESEAIRREERHARAVEEHAEARARAEEKKLRNKEDEKTRIAAHA